MTNVPTDLSNDDWQSLTAQIELIRPVLELDGWFSYDDIETPNETRPRDVLRKLEFRSAVRSDYTPTESGHWDVKKYRWKKDVKERLERYDEQTDKLPCGHRWHIKNPKDMDGYSCRYCIEMGEKPQWTKEKLMEVKQ